MTATEFAGLFIRALARGAIGDAYLAEEAQGVPKTNGRREWTQFIHRAFAAAAVGDVERAGRGLLVPTDAASTAPAYSTTVYSSSLASAAATPSSPRTDGSEYRWDLVWAVETAWDAQTTSETYRYAGPSLVMESEWSGNSGVQRAEDIIEDYYKILDCGAPLRVMVFENAHEEWESGIGSRRACDYRECITAHLEAATQAHIAASRAIQRGESVVVLLDVGVELLATVIGEMGTVTHRLGPQREWESLG